jgi:hypothetical protein
MTTESTELPQPPTAFRLVLEAIVRHLLSVACTALAAHGVLTAGDHTREVLLGSTGAIVMMGWSLLQKLQHSQYVLDLEAAAKARIRRAIAGSGAAVTVLLVALSGALVVAMPGCSVLPTPKVAIDTLDRSTYTAARAFQQAVEADYAAHQAWPTFSERHRINVVLGGDPTCVPSATLVCKKGLYDLVVDVANIGINLPPGAQLSIEDLKICRALEQAMLDLTSLVSTTAAQTIQDKATALTTTASTLLASVKGATQ